MNAMGEGPPEEDYDTPEEFFNGSGAVGATARQAPPPPAISGHTTRAPSTDFSFGTADRSTANDDVITSQHPIFADDLRQHVTTSDINITADGPPLDAIDFTDTSPVGVLKDEKLYSFDRFNGKREWRRNGGNSSPSSSSPPFKKSCHRPLSSSS
mmetsp:Transcript_46481/g.56303  ORF Transcript_46481/g.56303 Transcript_46481/m.56303 type:complete len:155 (+) Transcript_46481:216-680(+)